MPQAHQRRIAARAFTGMIDAHAEICQLYCPEENRNGFEAARFASGETLEAVKCGEATAYQFDMATGFHLTVGFTQKN